MNPSILRDPSDGEVLYRRFIDDELHAECGYAMTNNDKSSAEFYFQGCAMPLDITCSYLPTAGNCEGDTVSIHKMACGRFLAASLFLSRSIFSNPPPPTSLSLSLWSQHF